MGYMKSLVRYVLSSNNYNNLCILQKGCTTRPKQKHRGIPRGLAKHNSQLTRVQELSTLDLTAADNTRHHSRLHNSSDTELPRRRASS
ncbi:hypothetical protein Taro_020846 [Colocasia esculenta]|uniref:Uncharacterized protein n=1 Tax=Colocasia esculenta TaxID=4460 RepID=A0A843UXE7_COLES|nr:hypothetical protein [Colocasia esculenta]